MKNEIKLSLADYEKIQDLSHHINCTVTADDFNTNHPNPYRIDYAISDINNYIRNVKRGENSSGFFSNYTF